MTVTDTTATSSATTTEPAAHEDVESLRLQLAQTQAALEVAQRYGAEQIAAFKDRVRSVARSYAREHSWCSVVDNALDDLGVATSCEYKFEVLLRVQVNANLIAATPDDPTAFVRRSLSVDTSSDSEVELELDDDWEDLDIRSVTVESVENVEQD